MLEVSLGTLLSCNVAGLVALICRDWEFLIGPVSLGFKSFTKFFLEHNTESKKISFSRTVQIKVHKCSFKLILWHFEKFHQFFSCNKEVQHKETHNKYLCLCLSLTGNKLIVWLYNSTVIINWTVSMFCPLVLNEAKCGEILSGYPSIIRQFINIWDIHNSDGRRTFICFIYAPYKQLSRNMETLKTLHKSYW